MSPRTPDTSAPPVSSISHHSDLEFRHPHAAHAAAGNAENAEASYREALEALTEARQWRDAAHVARQLSQLLRTLGREQEAYELVDHASLLVIRHVAGVRRPARSGAH